MSVRVFVWVRAPASVAVGRGSFGGGLRSGIPFDGALYHELPVRAGRPNNSLFCLLGSNA